MPIYRWRPVTERQTVIDKFGGELERAIGKLRERGFSEGSWRAVRGHPGRYEIAATKFVKEEA